MRHEFTLAGEHTGMHLVEGQCSCGWRGIQRKRESTTAKAEARQEWMDHVNDHYRAIELKRRAKKQERDLQGMLRRQQQDRLSKALGAWR